MRRLSVAFFLVALLVPAVAHAQATLAGVVRDSSDAVLPGVTVEASSPVLIEKTRSAVTDGSGQYRITELPPGTYALTITLSGFSTVKREGVEVTGSGVFAINIAMKVGTVAETITVTGETPVVDTQSARRQAVLSNDIIKALPATRSYGALLTAIPGVMVDNTANNGAMTTPFMTFFSANGGRSNEGRMMLDGLNVAASFNGGGVSTFIYDVANTEEMQVSVSGSLGEAENGGPQVNLVPKSGGNRFNGSFFYQGAGDWSSGDNLTDTLRKPVAEGGSGLTAPAKVISSWDANGSGGGPIKRDKLWFYGNLRKYSTLRPVPGAYANLNAGDASKWLFVRDPNIEVRNADSRTIESFRLTSQVTARNRVSFSHEHQHRCSGSTLTASGEGCRTRGDNWVAIGNTTTAPESFPGYHDFPYNVTQATWTSPMTSRLLLEAGYSRFQYLWAGFGIAPPDTFNSLMPVTEQTTMYGAGNFSYRGLYDPLAIAYADNDASPTNWRATASYVTGAHNMKVGYQGSYQKSLQGRVASQTQMQYRFSGGVPNAFSYYLAPRWEQNDRTATGSLFVQDQWTRNRLTLQGGLRYDRAWSFAPAEHNGTTETSRFNPQPISFAETVSVKGYNDITPRMGAAYDVFGTGKTAIKMNLGKYLQAATNDENYWANNPAGRIVTSVTNRSWTDANGNYAIDCDVSNTAQQDRRAAGGDFCGSVGGNQLNFGSANPGSTIVNPAILEGWGIRPSDWQFGVQVQQELLPRVALNVGYNRRWFQNFFVTDNTLTTAADYDTWNLTVPQNPLLPTAGSTQTYYAITQAASSRGAQNYQTFETDYAPARVQYWHGATVDVNARLRGGLTLQGGTTTGRGVRDTCALFGRLPELAGTQPISACSVTEPWMTQARGLVSYTVPKADVNVSVNWRSVPNAALATASNGTSRNANAPVPSAVIQQSLGRAPANSVANVTVNMLNPAQLYGERISQVDMRFAKIVRFSRIRAEVGADLLNLLNTSDVTGYIETFDWPNGATWLRPNAIVAPRFVRFNLRFDF
jgi:hypothetical protein